MKVSRTLARGRGRTPVAAAFLFGLLPFAIPGLLTSVLILTVGEAWPRNIAPGSGLKLWGLSASVVTAAGVWRMVRRRVDDEQAVRFAALLCVMTGLMGWPLWSVGVLPSINGSSLGPEMTVAMRLERLESTRQSRQRGFHRWAWLTPQDPSAGLEAGRYFIPQDVYRRWTEERPGVVRVRYASGALGARAVTGFH